MKITLKIKLTGAGALTTTYYVKSYQNKIVFTAALNGAVKNKNWGSKFLLIC